MSIHYSVQELLQLRESPLVKKPDGLPPIEQWMGPPIDPNQRRPGQPRSKTDEANSNDFDKRPSLQDTHVLRRSTTATENIVLGPPKTAFASSSSTRNLGRAAPHESGDSNTLESPRLTKSFSRDHDVDEGDVERRGGRFGGMNGRRYDKEEWVTRSRRDAEGDEFDRRPRRDIDSRWNKKSGGFGEEPRKGPREDTRYGKPGRARFEQPWFRGENGGEAMEEDGKSQQRPRGWTRDRRSGGVTDDWNARTEQDPEWMESLEVDEPKQAHTAEDFQKWKERMKADNEKRNPSSEAAEALEGLSMQEREPASKARPTIKPDTDKFFEIFGEKPATDEAPAMAESKKHKTRFASLFSPPPEEPKSAVEPIRNEVPPPSNRPASTDADQEGFQRILQMLGGKGKANALPMEALFNPKSAGSRPDQMSPNPLAGLFMNQDLPKPDQQMPEAKPPSRSSGGLESLLGPQSPRPDQKRDSAPNKDSEFLLRLMQQSKMSPSPQPTQQQGPQSNHIPGLLQMPESLNRSRQPAKSPSGLPPFFDDLAMANNQRMPPPQAENFDVHQRLGPPPQMQGDYPPRSDYPKSPQDQPPHLPPSMQRPPGFDSGPPPAGWPHQHQHHQQFPPLQQHGPMHAPLGMPNPGQSRGMPPFHPGGPPMPPHHNMPMAPPQETRQQQQQPPPQSQQQQRKLQGGGGVPFPPPGMQPPPGFLGNHPGGPPPPGFPPMPMGGNEGMGGMPMGPGPRDMGGPPLQPGMPPRHLMDLFAMSGGGGGGDRGGRVGGGSAAGGGMPGPYR